jgi:hypothetical protein
MNRLSIVCVCACLFAIACGGAEPEAAPRCEEARTGVCASSGCFSFNKCDAPISEHFFAEDVTCTATGESGDPELPYAYTCAW